MRRIRTAEEDMEKQLGDRIKVVERAGTQLKNLLWKPDPWNGTGCMTVDCQVCSEEDQDS